jgi:hypothetical protein
MRTCSVRVHAIGRNAHTVALKLFNSIIDSSAPHLQRLTVCMHQSAQQTAAHSIHHVGTPRVSFPGQRLGDCYQRWQAPVHMVPEVLLLGMLHLTNTTLVLCDAKSYC